MTISVHLGVSENRANLKSSKSSVHLSIETYVETYFESYDDLGFPHDFVNPIHPALRRCDAARPACMGLMAWSLGDASSGSVNTKLVGGF
jgi:hypothetical protein